MAGSRPLDLEEIALLMSMAPTARERALVCLFAGTGLRLKEIRSARRSSVLNADGAITGRIHIPQKGTKGSIGARLLILPQPARDALAEWLLEHPSDDRNAALFPSNRDPLVPLCTRQLQRIFTTMARRAKLDGRITAHSFRKFFARTMHIALGNDINLTARALNHRNPASTMYYLDDGAAVIETASAAVLGTAFPKSA